MTLFNERIEIYTREGSWCRPGEWVWEVTKCPNGCIILDLGWWGIDFNKSGCRNAECVPPPRA